MKFPARTIAALCSLALLQSAFAEDWPQILGPNRNGISTEAKLAETWPDEGPPIVWQRKIGHGFSAPSVAKDKLILFHRVDNEEVIEACDAKTGKALWKFEYPTAYRDDFGFDDGPRAAPTIADGKVYCMGAEGAIHCLDFETGREIWAVNSREKFSAAKGFFGLACSPLVEGDKVLVNIGGSDGAGIVALQNDTGKLLWKATKDEASYSSPVAAVLNNHRYALFFTRRGLVVLEPNDGSVEFEFPWRSRDHASVNAATPLVIGDQIFLSAAYGTGATLLKWENHSATKVWSSEDAISCHYATVVHRDGFLYGFHGAVHEQSSLRCVELKSGKVMWNEDSISAGTTLLVGDRLLILLYDGRLILAAASPAKFQKLAEAQILSSNARAYPALANGLLYARSADRLACFDLKPAH